MDPRSSGGSGRLEEYLSSPPILVAPRPQEPLLLYVIVTNQTVSDVLVAEREQEQAKQKKMTFDGIRKPRVVQFPVYYISSMLREARERYPEIQKILLGVVLAARKLRHYFEAHPITVRTSYPLQRVLSNAHAVSRVAECAVELSHFDIRFDNSKAIKGKALADFLADWTDWTPTPMEELESLSPLPRAEDPDRWIMYFDRAFSYEGVGVRVVIEAPTGEQLKYVIQMDFEKGKTSNNVAEYEGLQAGLRAMAGLGIQRLVVRGDSQLVVNQVCKEYDYPRMKAYVEEVHKLELQFEGLQMEHIPRGENFVADELSKIASRREPVPLETFVERLTRPSVETQGSPDKGVK